MNLKITQKKIIGSPDPDGWVIITDFIPVSSDLAIKKGHLYTLISMTPKEGTKIPPNESSLVSREILTRLYEEYFNKSGNEFNLLENSIKEIAHTFTSPNQSLHILVAVVLGNKIILSGSGHVEVLVKRDGSLSKIIESASGKTASGIVKNGDEFFLATSSCFTKITPELLKSASNFQELIKNPSSTIGLLGLQIEFEETPLPRMQALPQRPPEIKSQTPPKISPFRIGLVKLIDQILKLLPEKRSYVKEEFTSPAQISKKRQLTTTIGFILLILLIISIIFGAKQKKLSDSKNLIQPVISSVQHELSEAESISSVNGARARDLILTAKSQIEDLQAKKIQDPTIQSLSDKIKNDLGSIAGIYLEDPSMYLDLTLLNPNFKGDDIASSDDRMVVLDRAGKRLETININTSRADPVAGPDTMPNAISVAAYSDRNFVSASDGIWEIGDKATNVIKKDWGDNALICAYAGNFYVLDKTSSKVWRFVGDGGIFDPKQNWFGAGVSPDLTNIVSWTLDGNVWMLTRDNKILRFSGGSPVDFSLANIDKDLNAVSIFTTQDSKYLYILDTGNARVVVVDKEGNYKAQYLSDNIKNASKIIVSEADKKIILLEGTKLFSLDIKHL